MKNIKKPKTLMVANWKMNPVSLKEAKQLFQKVKNKASKLSRVETVICPPFIYLDSLKTTGQRCSLGAQDLFWEPSGSYTGNISYLQLKNMGLKYTIVGHSERRAMGETDQHVNLKLKAGLQGVMTPIVCIGETERDEEGEYLLDLKEQITSAFSGVSKSSIKDIVIAYEPVWAIGKNAKRDATPREVFEVTIFIKKVLSDLYSTKSIPPIRILYGGSVDKNNIIDLFKEGGVDGFLVGRASLSYEIFNQMLEIVENIKK